MTKKTPLLAQISLALSALALVAAATASTPAEARGSKAQVFLVQAKIPKGLTEKGLLGFAKSHRAKFLRETDEANVDDRSWRAEMIINFSQPVGDLEFQVLFYDVHDGAPRFVEDMSTFVNDKKQRTFVQKVKLPRKSFKPNRDMELVVTVRRQEVGRMRFSLVGKEKQRSGEVSFSDKER